MDWRALLHNKWALAGLGLAGVAGLYVLIKRRGATAPSTASSSQASPGYSASGAVGGFDSTGTDVAAWLGNYSGFLDNQFAEFKKDVLAGLAQVPTGTTGTGSLTNPIVRGFPDVYRDRGTPAPGGLVVSTSNPDGRTRQTSTTVLSRQPR